MPKFLFRWLAIALLAGAAHAQVAPYPPAFNTQDSP
ncbi:hypothetical protein H6CHR_04733 [Variovorax sp. PBL-H6]|nr:hypothetical protein H6CHR_04733 [Variovorax sp. PBL-H6]